MSEKDCPGERNAPDPEEHAVEGAQSLESENEPQEHSVERVQSLGSENEPQGHSVERAQSLGSENEPQGHSVEGALSLRSQNEPQGHSVEGAQSLGSENEPHGHVVEGAQLLGPKNYQEILQEIERPFLEAESRDSGHDSPFERAVGGELEVSDPRRSSRQRMRIKPGKEDLFRKFFSDEYDEPKGPILDRRRHSARKQTVRRRHLSEKSNLDQNLLGCLQDVGTSSGVVLNQAGAIIGKSIPREEIPDYQRFGTEYGQSLPPTGSIENYERSAGSFSTARIGDLYGGSFSEPPSDSSRGLSPGIQFPSFTSRPPTAASNDRETLLLQINSENGKQVLETSFTSEAQEKPIRVRRFGVVAWPMPTRSKSAPGGYFIYNSDELGEPQKRKTSNDMSVCSEPLPQLKISKDFSTDYYEQISLEDDDTNYPELSHSLESDFCQPMPDIDPLEIAKLQENLTVLSIEVTQAVAQNVEHNTEASISENHAVTPSGAVDQNDGEGIEASGDEQNPDTLPPTVDLNVGQGT